MMTSGGRQHRGQRQATSGRPDRTIDLLEILQADEGVAGDLEVVVDEGDPDRKQERKDRQREDEDDGRRHQQPFEIAVAPFRPGRSTGGRGAGAPPRPMMRLCAMPSRAGVTGRPRNRRPAPFCSVRPVELSQPCRASRPCCRRRSRAASGTRRRTPSASRRRAVRWSRPIPPRRSRAPSSDRCPPTPTCTCGRWRGRSPARRA